METLKEKYAALVNAYKEDPDIMEFIAENMARMEQYVSSVYMQEAMVPQILLLYEGEAQRDKLQSMDQSRRFAHESAIAAVAQLTRLSEKAGIEPMFRGDASDRYQVADFCVEVVGEFFRNGQRKAA